MRTLIADDSLANLKPIENLSFNKIYNHKRILVRVMSFASTYLEIHARRIYTELKEHGKGPIKLMPQTLKVSQNNNDY